jgi:hypothetical protein
MHQSLSLHLLIVDFERHAALVAQPGGRWILPVLCAPERARLGPLLLEWAGRHGIAGRLVGQWLGRVAPDADTCDWLAVLQAAATPSVGGASSLEWRSLASLASSSSWLAYQQWAVGRALSTTGVPTVPGPFGTVTWMDDVEAWLKTATSHRGRLSALVPHRTTASEVVLEVRTTCGLAYFKGLSSDRAPEVDLTSHLAGVAPHSFARTIAQSTRPDETVWWLMAACRGSTLAARPSRAAAARAVEAWAHVQQRASSALALPPGDLAPFDLPSMAAWAAGLLREAGEQQSRPCAAAIAAMSDACERVDNAHVPRSWVWADFDPTNVLVHGDEVRFIDLDDCRVGPAPIAVSTFARRLARIGMPCAGELYRSYERAWEPAIDMGSRWHDFEVVSMVVECYLAWQRVVLKTGRNEIYDCLGPARDAIVRRLVRVVTP